MRNSQIYKLNDFYSMYRDEKYNYETILSGQIFLAYPKQFNDPFDCMYFIDDSEFEIEYLKKIYGESIIDSNLIQLSKKSIASSIFDQILLLQIASKYNFKVIPSNYKLLLDLDLESLKNECHKLLENYRIELDRVRNKYGISCFTTNHPVSNMVMWAHYANNYKGFCCRYNFGNIKYDLDTDRIDNYGYFLLKHFNKVKYVTKFEKLDCQMLLNIELQDVYTSPYINRYIRKLLFRKHAQWKYENEYRLVIDKTKCKFIEAEFEQRFKIKFDYLYEVYISSSNIKNDDEDEIIKIAKKHNIKYRKLKTSNGYASLQEDKSILNYHNIMLDANNIF